jgi:hypothetical protein
MGSSHVSLQAYPTPGSQNDTDDPIEGALDTQSASRRNHFDPTTVIDSHPEHTNDVLFQSTDLWSTALREAINTLEPAIDVAQLTGKPVEQLFHDLGMIQRSTDESSTFRRGLAHVRSVKGPLQNLKLALDLTNPLISLELVAATVIGVVRGVITVS